MRTGWWRTLRRLSREMGRYRRAAPKLLTVGWSGWRALAKAQVALWWAQRELHRRPTGELVRDGALQAQSSGRHADRHEEIREIAKALNRAARFGFFRPKCLVRSMGLRRMIDDAGISGATVRVGVQVLRGRFNAHAWVEYDGEVVGDDAALVARYVPLTGLQVAEFE